MEIGTVSQENLYKKTPSVDHKEEDSTLSDNLTANYNEYFTKVIIKTIYITANCTQWVQYQQESICRGIK